jgi:broad specificity phosphatase PhoE
VSSDKPVYRFVFLRHAESVGNVESRWQGQKNYPLTDKGRAQARALCERWERERVKFDLVITSTLTRARETAEIVTSYLEGIKIEFNPILMERHIGQIEGMTRAEVDQLPPPRYTTPYHFLDEKGEGEGDWALFLRAGQALQEFLRKPPGKYLVVSHGGFLNQLMHAVIGIAPHVDPSGVRFRFENTSFARVVYYPQQHRWLIDTLNDRAHLKSLKYE